MLKPFELSPGSFSWNVLFSLDISGIRTAARHILLYETARRRWSVYRSWLGVRTKGGHLPHQVQHKSGTLQSTSLGNYRYYIKQFYFWYKTKNNFYCWKKSVFRLQMDSFHGPSLKVFFFLSLQILHRGPSGRHGGITETPEQLPHDIYEGFFLKTKFPLESLFSVIP